MRRGRRREDGRVRRVRVRCGARDRRAGRRHLDHEWDVGEQWKNGDGWERELAEMRLVRVWGYDVSRVEGSGLGARGTRGRRRQNSIGLWLNLQYERWA